MIGVIGDYFAVAETKAFFEKMVTIDKEGKGGLDESTKFTDAMDAAESEGLAHVYVDIGGLIEKAGSQIPPETETFFDLTGIEPRKRPRSRPWCRTPNRSSSTFRPT